MASDHPQNNPIKQTVFFLEVRTGDKPLLLPITYLPGPKFKKSLLD